MRLPSTRPSVPARLWWVVVLALPAGVGCRADECLGGERRCRENVAESCVGVSDTELTGHTEWRVEPCGARFCAVPPAGVAGGAFCALGDSLDPECPVELRAASDASACLDGHAVRWSFGFRVGDDACAAGAACVDEWHPEATSGCDAAAFCAAGSSPDPLCGPGVFTACADETTIVYCRCGFRVDAHACANPGPRCVLEDGGGGLQGVCR
ncbi:MAG: hypothetical protein HY907_12510 [Deltaproteobacteria bacterium]|nr:hypothetical protein [Deltaproteobacteria bacterium]